jgi:hypothetical protein
MMTLARAPEDEQSCRQRDTGPAKKKSHNASESKRPGLGGARGKLWKKETPVPISAGPELFSD